MSKITPKTFTFLLICLTLFSCSKENGNYGSLVFEIKGDVKVSVSSSNTKAATVNTDNFEIFLNQTSLGLKKDITAPIQLAPGTYSVSAQNCSAEIANTNNGMLRFVGEDKNIVIENEKVATASINCIVVNSKVSVNFGESYLSYFDSGYTNVVVSDGTRTLTVIQNGAVVQEAVYFDANKSITITVDSKKTSASGTPHTFQTTGTITTFAATWHKITLNADLNSSGGISFTNQDSHVSNWISVKDYSPGSVTEDN